MNRCPWCVNDPLYVEYHDKEWGVPVFEDQKQFEFLVLESAQAGLSWLTILKRRENYREAYNQFDPVKVAKYDDKKFEELMNNPGIIRNRKKIEASINNAREFLKVVDEFGSFSNYLWGYVDRRPIVNHFTEISQVPATTELSERISKDMKKRGFKFLGPVIIYAHLQAVGLVNDHITSCYRYNEINEAFKDIIK